MKRHQSRGHPQTMPKEFNKNCEALCCYAKSFFGFGSWKADYWLIGLEEFGCTEAEDEFKRRYRTWKKRKSKLVELKTFFKKCNIPNTPDWGNQTWRGIHRLCEQAGLRVGSLCVHNNRWGGTHKVGKSSRHLALIELMPFATPPRRDNDKWPYSKHWRRFGFMNNRGACKKMFLLERFTKLERIFRKYHPKLTIFYGRGTKQRPFSELDWKTYPIKRKHARVKASIKLHWARDHSSKTEKKPLVCCIPHPSYLVKYGGGYSVIKKIASKIKSLLKNS